MDNEVKTQEGSNTEPVAVETTQLTSHEELASKSGWKPQEEWEGNPDDWIPAKEFNQRGELLDRIKTQSSHIKKLEKKQSTLESTINELADHHRKVAETERKKALDELKGLKKQALDLGDHDKVIEIDDRIDDLKQATVEEPTKKEVKADTHPAVIQWIDENPWYSSDSKGDKILRAAMETLVHDVLDESPDLRDNPAEVLKRAEQQLKDEFPGKFNKAIRSTVTESSSNGEGRGKSTEPKFSIKNLTEDQRAAAKKFIAVGAIKSYEEYAKQLAEYDQRFGG